jgi:type II secretory pathway pseudopilin PulG
MKSVKCQACGFVGWSDGVSCKSCGAAFVERPFVPPTPLVTPQYSTSQPHVEGESKGLAIFALVLGILSFLTFGLLGIGAVTGIIVGAIAINRVKQDPWTYGGKGIAIAGLCLSITSLVTAVPIGIIAAIAIPNLLAARVAANEGSAINSLRKISAAEATYQAQFERYGTLEELATAALIDPALAGGVKNGYRFAVELRPADYSTRAGFEVTGVPVKYSSSGRRSFFTDETLVIRAADNHGGPSTVFDAPLNSDYEYRTRRNGEREFATDVGY